MSTLPTEQPNAITTFETAYGTVSLSPEIVSNYLKRGNKNLTDQDITLFINLCKYHKLNPFVNEAYAIKFGDDFQMVIGYDTYKRRAEENPAYHGRKSGIVVLRGDQVVQKEGTCLYPSEKLLGGWCRVFRELHGTVVEDYKEVSLTEYDKGQSNWKTKPATMIEKVAVSQALRSAFPTDFAGIYTAEELPAQEDAPGSQQQGAGQQQGGDGEHIDPQTGEVDKSGKVTDEQRRKMFDQAKQIYGNQSVERVKKFCDEKGFKATTEMTVAAYEEFMETLADEYSAMLDQVQAEGSVQ